MLTIDDYMKLSKRRLAEMLVERDELEETIENKIAEKIAEIIKDFPIRPSWPMNPNPIQPNPLNPLQPITVLYGCPGQYDTIVSSKDFETTSTSQNIEQ